MTSYYAETAGLNGQDLKAALHRIVRQGHRLTYNQVWNEITYTDADPAHEDNVVMVYSHRSLPVSSLGDDIGHSWNREHIWPKSHGFPRINMPAHTDLHHIRPCEVVVNNVRGDLMFADLAAGEPVALAAGALVDASRGLFTPPPESRGDVARMLFYMDTRYAGDNPREPDLRLVNSLPPDLHRGVDEDGNGYLGYLRTLLEWHEQDPVDAFERRRNERVYERQKNRNPFIDHPEFAGQIYR